jgi:two-component system, OmpR family, alkaline phosphatase synthesis response regulator PhoP
MVLRMTGRILVVEDDLGIARAVRAYLEKEGFEVDVVTDGLLALQRALAEAPLLIVLDWMLPGLDGLKFMRRLRQEQRTPIIMLTARIEENDRILGLEFGADDYVTKPFSPRELVARVKAVLRRTEGAEEEDPEVLVAGPLVIDLVRHTVTRDDVPLELTVLEFNLLHTLAVRPGRVFTRDELLSRVWGTDFVGVDRVVDVHVSHLRHKLEADPEVPTLILTVRGVGYKLAEGGA